jgi:hypothetical protein
MRIEELYSSPFSLYIIRITKSMMMFIIIINIIIIIGGAVLRP